MSKGKKLFTLFYSMLFISACTFGGGFVIVTFMKKRMVDELKWIDEKEMLDYVAFAQASPGAIAVNAAILVGWKVAGFPGMMVAVLGTVIPPMAIITVITFFYNAFISNRVIAVLLKGMQVGVAAVILHVVYELAENVFREHPRISIPLAVLSFLAVFCLHVPVMVILGIGIVLGIVSALLEHRRAEKEAEE